ncbi:MAG TPA: sigma-70 family RNA polymerase sigma factor [Candidatus Paceibacterota bacterium]|nr:sigma-70 family RNA polymerase sigma factor [Candidatus Paceibacterota bacterium]HVN66852.1 sigma-70 family RNA polymerase sigma factor [Candidatus Sulfotelmatobacter sp.]
MMTDEELVQAYRAGDEAALRTLIERHLGPVYAFVHRYVGPTGDAEDIAQETFVSAWRNIDKFDPGRKFRTWLYAIAKNASLNWLKKKRPAAFSEFDLPTGENPVVDTAEDPAPLPDELFSRTELAAELTAAMTILPPNARAVLSLYYNDHMTLQEISEVLGEPLNTTKSRHRRALQMLRRKMVEKGDNAPKKPGKL